jgi:hypothetical protein
MIRIWPITQADWAHLAAVRTPTFRIKTRLGSKESRWNAFIHFLSRNRTKTWIKATTRYLTRIKANQRCRWRERLARYQRCLTRSEVLATRLYNATLKTTLAAKVKAKEVDGTEILPSTAGKAPCRQIEAARIMCLKRCKYLRSRWNRTIRWCMSW